MQQVGLRILQKQSQYLQRERERNRRQILSVWGPSAHVGALSKHQAADEQTESPDESWSSTWSLLTDLAFWVVSLKELKPHHSYVFNFSFLSKKARGKIYHCHCLSESGSKRERSEVQIHKLKKSRILSKKDDDATQVPRKRTIRLRKAQNEVNHKDESGNAGT